MGAINMTGWEGEERENRCAQSHLDRTQCLRMFEGRILRATRGFVPQGCIPRAQPPGRPTTRCNYSKDFLVPVGGVSLILSSRVCVRAPPYRFPSST